MSSGHVRDGLVTFFESAMSRFATAKLELDYAIGIGNQSLQQIWTQALRKALNDADTALLVLCQKRGTEDPYVQAAQALLTDEREYIHPLLDEDFAYGLTNVLDALSRSLFFVENSCKQLENEIHLHHFENVAHTAQQATNVLLRGFEVYGRVATGLQDLNASAAVLIPIKERMDKAQAMMIVLLKCVRAEEAAPKICQLMDDLQDDLVYAN